MNVNSVALVIPAFHRQDGIGPRVCSHQETQGCLLPYFIAAPDILPVIEITLERLQEVPERCGHSCIENGSIPCSPEPIKVRLFVQAVSWKRA